MKTHRTHKSRAAFTLAEVIVASALIVIIMGLLLSTVNQTQRLWQRTTTRVAQFQSARTAFDSLSRRLSQASLNTYWRAYDSNTDAEKEDFSFTRKAELQFISGPTAAIFKQPQIPHVDGELEKVFPTHSLFFHAPLGYTEEMVGGKTASNAADSVARYRNLDSMLMACGYFVEFGDEDRPDFLIEDKKNFPPKYRYRLKELNVPSEMLTIYRRPEPGSDEKKYTNEQFILEAEGTKLVQNDITKKYIGLVDTTRKLRDAFTRPDWMQVALFREKTTDSQVARFRFARTLSDNVIALIVLPKYAEKDRSNPYRIDELAPDFAYDSWRIVPPNKRMAAQVNRDFPTRDCLLPPVVQVTMVAIDEPSAIRMALDPGKLPALADGLFAKVTTEIDFRRQLEEFEKALRDTPGKPSYRIFHTDVVLRGSKWVRNKE